MNFTRTSYSNVLSTPSSPASIAASGNSSGTFAVGNTTAAILGGAVIIGSSAPGTNPLVQFAYSLDGGTTYINDYGSYSVPITTTSTTYNYSYPLPEAATHGKVTVTNGTTNAITAWFQGASEAIS